MENCNYCSKIIVIGIEFMDYDEIFCSEKCANIWFEDRCAEQDAKWEA